MSGEQETERYEVLEGFVRLPVLRGFESIRELFMQVMQRRCFICGGYPRFMASPTVTPKLAGDVDIYCSGEEAFQSMKEWLLGGGCYTVRHENDVSLSLGRPTCDNAPIAARYGPLPQLIKPIKEGAIVATGSMEDVLGNFDFTVVRAGLMSETECLVDANFEHDEQKQVLRFINIHCPVSSLLRACKYSRKGYWLQPSQALKLFIDWSARSEDYRSRLCELFAMSLSEKELTQEQIDELEHLLRID